ncbi:MAG: long-chain fatty acid--CoA ligase, partial [Spirochaetia bacterium]|nr:long-chain fatty acid--CoA ligase [Spirochaetia bacterium]
MTDVTRLFDLLARCAEKYDKPDAVAAREKGLWKKYSTRELISHCNDVSSGLLALGLSKGDRIATLSNNRPEWNFLDLGMLQIGVIHIPIYPNASDSDLAFILADAKVSHVFVSNGELYARVKKTSEGIPGIRGIHSFDAVTGAAHFSEVVDAGKKQPNPALVGSIQKSIGPNDLATILYTSGTTGNPKGVMLSHENLISNFKAMGLVADMKSHWKALSFLPLNHVYERMLTYLYLYEGISIYYAESLDTIVDNLKEIRPHLFATVPRLLEKVYDRIVARGAELKGIKKRLFDWALRLGLAYEPEGAKGFWYELQLKIANKLIFNKWREALGGNVEIIVSGGAALQPRLARVFWAARIPVLEGYGLTETSHVIAVNQLHPGGLRFGTVGPVIDQVRVKIAEDGEILVQGPNVMLGYRDRPDLTAEAIDAEGWFHTGDIGILEEGKFLKITDRKKEIFKTSGGKYIAPQLIENKLKESVLIEQALVIGENQKFASALIVPAFAQLRRALGLD